jgi:hypothetical protein
MRVVEATKNEECGDCGNGAHHVIPALPWFGDTLIDALMRARLAEVSDVFVQDAPQVGLAHVQDVVQALAAQAADQALAHSVRARRAYWRSDQGDPGSRRDSIEARAVFRIVVTDNVLRRGAEGRRLPQLLRDPGIRRRAGDSGVDNAP